MDETKKNHITEKKPPLKSTVLKVVPVDGLLLALVPRPAWRLSPHTTFSGIKKP